MILSEFEVSLIFLLGLAIGAAGSYLVVIVNAMRKES